MSKQTDYKLRVSKVTSKQELGCYIEGKMSNIRATSRREPMVAIPQLLS